MREIVRGAIFSEGDPKRQSLVRVCCDRFNIN